MTSQSIYDWAQSTGLPKHELAELLVHTLEPKTSLDSLSWYLAHENDVIDPAHLPTLNDLAKRRGLDEPLAYITNTVQFRDLTLYVDDRVLIPRQETEELVEFAINYIKGHSRETRSAATPESKSETDSGLSNGRQNDQILTIAEIGTGSGAITLSLASWVSKNHLAGHIIATDISKKALTIAKENVKNLKFKIKNSRTDVEFRHGSLLEPITEKVDCIIANLPYIPSSEIPHLDKSVTSFEPHLALDGGSDGFELIRQLLVDAPRILKKDGVIFLEMWHDHTAKHFQEFETQFDIKIVSDSFGKTRFAILKHKGEVNA